MKRTGIDPGRLLPQILILALALLAVLLPTRKVSTKATDASLRHAVDQEQASVNRWAEQPQALLHQPGASAGDVRRALQSREVLSWKHQAELTRISHLLEGSSAAFESGVRDLNRELASRTEDPRPRTAQLIP